MVRAMANALRDRDIDGSDSLEMLRALGRAGFSVKDVAHCWNQLIFHMANPQEKTP